MALKRVAKKRVAKKIVTENTDPTAAVKKRVTTKRRTTVKKRVAVKKQVPAKAANPESPIAMMEAAFSDSRANLAKAYESETAQQEKNLTKLKTQLERAIAKQNLLKERKEAALLNLTEKQTPAAKNRVARANDALKAGMLVVKETRAEIQSARAALGEAKDAQKKFSTLQKLIGGFESSYAKGTTKKRGVVRRTRKKATANATPSSSEEQAVVEVPTE